MNTFGNDLDATETFLRPRYSNSLWVVVLISHLRNDETQYLYPTEEAARTDFLAANAQLAELGDSTLTIEMRRYDVAEVTTLKPS